MSDKLGQGNNVTDEWLEVDRGGRWDKTTLDRVCLCVPVLLMCISTSRCWCVRVCLSLPQKYKANTFVSVLLTITHTKKPRAFKSTKVKLHVFSFKYANYDILKYIF